MADILSQRPARIPANIPAWSNHQRGRRLRGAPFRGEAKSGGAEWASLGAPGRYARRKAAFFEVLAGGAAGIASAFLARRNALSLAVLR